MVPSLGLVGLAGAGVGHQPQAPPRGEGTGEAGTTAGRVTLKFHGLELD